MTRLPGLSRGRVFALATLALAALALVGAGARATAPAGRYKISDRTVEDRRTGLVWQRTVATDRLGEASAEAACAGDLDDGGHWRLPTAAELLTLADVTAVAPAIDADAFPATPVGRYWSRTPYVRFDGQYWAVDFDDGSSGAAERALQLPFRCVRPVGVAP